MTDAKGLPIKIVITPGEAHDLIPARELLQDMQDVQVLLADKAYDADWLRNMVSELGARANIPPKSNRKAPIAFDPKLYKQRNLVERFFNKLKYFRRIATRYDKLAVHLKCGQGGRAPVRRSEPNTEDHLSNGRWPPKPSEIGYAYRTQAQRQRYRSSC